VWWALWLFGGEKDMDCPRFIISSVRKSRFMSVAAGSDFTI
jgi:hypothetical protein